MEGGGGGGGGGGGFGYGNLQNNPQLYKPSPPLSAIDRFLWGQNHFSNENSVVLKDKHTLGSLANNGLADFSSSSGAITSYESVGVSWPSIRNEHHHIISLDDSVPFLDEETCSWLHDINLNPNLGSNEEAKTAGKNSKRAGKKVKVGYSSSLIKGQWTEEEDRKLIRLVKQYGERKWAQIADKMVGRAGKQCRERWHNHLRPDIKKDGWSEEEERMLIEAHQMVGNKWAEIAKRIPGRTENTIKNHFNATKRRQNSRRKNKQEEKEGAKPQTSILQDYIKSNSLISSTTDSSTISADDPMNQYFSLSQPQQSESTTDDSPPLIHHTYDDDELLFIQNFFSSTNTHINQPSIDHQTNTGDHHNIYKTVTQGDEDSPAPAHDQNSSRLYSDMYLSYLLNGTTTYPSCFNDDEYYMNLDLVPDHQACSNGRMEMDLIEMVSYSQFSQGSSSSNSNF